MWWYIPGQADVFVFRFAGVFVFRLRQILGIARVTIASDLTRIGE